MKYIKLLLMVVVLYSPSLLAIDREVKIHLIGNIKENISKYITVKELEKDIYFIEQSVFHPYDKQTYLYGGVMFDEFVKKYAKDDVKAVKLIAFDDYTITIEKTDWESMRILLCTKINKEYIPIKLKGPLMTVFLDYDSKEKKYQESISKWIWMIKKIEFK